MITIDNLVNDLALFHPIWCWSPTAFFVATHVSQCILTNQDDLSQFVPHGLHFYLALALGVVVTAVQIGLFISARLYRFLVKTESWTLEPSKDTVVITGGARGLGLACATLLASKHFQVDVMDVVPPPQLRRHLVPYIRFHTCDISDRVSVTKLARQIIETRESENRAVCVVVNNAAIMRPNDLLNDSRFEDIIQVNLVGTMHVTQAFVPYLSQNRRGHLVTVTSILAKLSPARLSAYAASKAGLVALHDSLTHELARFSSGVRTLLYYVGQMDTAMFEGVQTPSPVIAPIVPAELVAATLVAAIEDGQVGSISTPLYTSLVLSLNSVVPQGVITLLRRAFGMDEAIDGLKRESDD